MSTRGIGDAFAFQRLLWLLIGTIVLPTVLLSLYGVMAIRNQQDAFEEQLRRGQSQQLQFAAQTLFDEIARVDHDVRSRSLECDLPCRSDHPQTEGVWVWGASPPKELEALGLPAVSAGRTTWFNPVDGSAPLGLFREGDRFGAWRLSAERLVPPMRTLTKARYTDGMQLELRKTSIGPATQIEELRKRWEADELEASVPLQRPLAQYEMVITTGENDPARSLLTSRWLYPLGLVLLVATVMAGTVITLNSAAREIRLSRLQTDFVSSVSHELRTPLTSIRMFVETLQSGRIQDQERIDECLGLMAQETDRLSRMIERMLSWARMEAGRRTYETEAVPVGELVSDALSAFRSQTFMQEEQVVHVSLADELPALSVDRDAVVEALVNLLQNAVKYTPSPRRIEIIGHRQGERVGLAVSDDGPGIRRVDRSRVFEKFFQSDTRLSSPTGAYRGSGLGLSIVRAIVQAHGGSVDLETEEDEGTMFTLWFPVKQPPGAS